MKTRLIKDLYGQPKPIGEIEIYDDAVESLARSGFEFYLMPNVTEDGEVLEFYIRPVPSEPTEFA